MNFKKVLAVVLLVTIVAGADFILKGQNNSSFIQEKNLALVATATAQNGSQVTTLNDGLIPTNTGKIRRPPNRAFMVRSPQWVQFEWNVPVSTGEISVFWWNYENSARLPVAYRLKYWNGIEFVPVNNPVGFGLENNKFNKCTFDVVRTTKLRLEADSTERSLITLLEWKVSQAPGTPDHPPVVNAGPDRCVIISGKTYLSGKIRSVSPVTKTIWKKISGPGNVTISDPEALNTSASFSALGDYVISLTAIEKDLSSASNVKVKVQQAPPAERLDVVYTKPYKINSPLWNSRAKALIVNWIPWCVDQINRSDLTLGQGGIDNFIEAGKALRGEPHKKHLGYVFSNAWVHQTVESMCIALMVDPQGDKDIIAAQEKMKSTLGKWIPIILAAQEPDGYLQTAYTLRDTAIWKNRWSPEARGNHEGYVSGYFIESAINHYTLTSGKDLRLYNSAKKLADCWVANIGPGKKEWYDGHQEMEQALVRFGRFVNDMEGNGRGDNYIKLAQFLLNCRKNGTEYDQSHVPVQQQYEAVGHAVRASYNYSAMADIAAETKDVDYQSAVMSVWDNLVNKKYYLTGGIGSGESAEGFGPDFSLPNNAYCEACSSCGLIFFEYKMNLAYNDAKYVDLYEETMYNALLGSIDLEGKHFYYDNPLESSQSRYSWHSCPCCVGNIPRTLLMIPTWTYAKSKDGLYVNLFIGSTIKVEKVAGTNIEMIQETDYPWSGNIKITVNPEQSKQFTLFIRVPDRSTSNLYKASPAVNGLKKLAVNGSLITPQISNGYAKINRIWKAGDKVEVVFPMEVQTITADDRIAADKGKVALRYGPLIYNVEKADQPDISKAIGNGALKPVWLKDLLGGVIAIKGSWADGSELTAIPNYARNNRNRVHATERPGEGDKDEASMVWMKRQ